MDLKKLVPVVWSNQLVLTTAQIAEAYKCSVKNISDNFNRVKEYFEEGIHYFCLDGMQIEKFRLYSEKIGMQISPMTRKLYLWTYQGCVRHCKILNTAEAWAVFDELEQFYFNQKPVAAPSPVVEPAAEKPDLARVYLLLLSDGTVQIVKIGQSKNFRARVAKIERETGLNVIGMYFTPPMPREVARLVEWSSQKILSSQRVKSEFFSVSFEEARKVVDYFVELSFAELPNGFNFVRGENISAIADK